MPSDGGPDKQPEEQSERPAAHAAESGSRDGASADAASGVHAVGYSYDEWNNHAGDYYRNWCRVHERTPTPREYRPALSPGFSRAVAEVRRFFERLKPEEVREEKRLQEGDRIHLDDFVEYISERQATPRNEMRFYTKPLTTRRDIAVALLLDLSGSTAEQTSIHATHDQPVVAMQPTRALRPTTVLDIEKEAALVLAEGLNTLGDRFAVFGFTGTGRHNCMFCVFKNLAEKWTDKRRDTLISATPGSATRIGPALRHAGWHLAQCQAKTKLLLLITDGKPCDQAYDTETHYAHYDVRKACQENARNNVHTFCVSTGENTPADLELMFPNGRYLNLEDISRLPRALAYLYLRITR
jgi:nitric oxide reductase activation protein